MIKYLSSVLKIKLELLDSILLLSSAVIFFKSNFAKIVQEHYPNVKPFGSRSGPSGSKVFASVFSRLAIKNQWHDQCFSIYILFFRPPLSS